MFFPDGETLQIYEDGIVVFSSRNYAAYGTTTIIYDGTSVKYYLNSITLFLIYIILIKIIQFY
jgi:hypothetical protein